MDKSVQGLRVKYIHHSCFLVETEESYYLFDYEKGSLPEMDREKPIFVLSSHGHGDHYNPEIFSILTALGMKKVRGVLSDDIQMPEKGNVLQVSPRREYDLGSRRKITTFRSTDMGVAFLIEDQERLIYHAGDLNDWVWEEESDSYNEQMTANYRKEIKHLGDVLQHRQIDVAFVVLDPRQGKDYDRGLCHFLEHIPAKQVYPMHYWGNPAVMDTFLQEHPEYQRQIRRTE